MCTACVNWGIVCTTEIVSAVSRTVTGRKHWKQVTKLGPGFGCESGDVSRIPEMLNYLCGWCQLPTMSPKAVLSRLLPKQIVCNQTRTYCLINHIRIILSFEYNTYLKLKTKHPYLLCFIERRKHNVPQRFRKYKVHYNTQKKTTLFLCVALMNCQQHNVLITVRLLQKKC